ncbi:unnamed protein product [Coccothraustes coccothraustes]
MGLFGKISVTLVRKLRKHRRTLEMPRGRTWRSFEEESRDDVKRNLEMPRGGTWWSFKEEPGDALRRNLEVPPEETWRYLKEEPGDLSIPVSSCPSHCGMALSTMSQVKFQFLLDP